MKNHIKLLLTIFVTCAFSGNALAFYDLKSLDKPVVKEKKVKVSIPVKVVNKPVVTAIVPVVVKSVPKVKHKAIKHKVDKPKSIYTPSPEVAAMVKKVKAEHYKKTAKHKVVKKHYKKSVKHKAVKHKRRYVSKSSVSKILKMRRELAKL